MNNRSELFYALNSAIESIVTCPSAGCERVVKALRELQHLKKTEFTERMEQAYFEQINAFKQKVQSGKASDDELRRVLSNLWALYKSVEKSLATQP